MTNVASNHGGTLPAKKQVSIRLDHEQDNNNNNQPSSSNDGGAASHTESLRSVGSSGGYSSDDGSYMNGSYDGASFYSNNQRINLMRRQTQRDPMKIYSILEVLGEGSMGRVCRVRKRSEAVGGSARKSFVLKHKGCCFQLFSHVQGWIQKIFPPVPSSVVEVPSDSNRSHRSINFVENDHHGEEEAVIDSTSTLSMSQRPQEQSKQQKQQDNQIQKSTNGSSDNNNNNNSGRSGASSATTSTATAGSNRRKLMYKKHSSLISFNTHKEVAYALKSIHLDRCSSATFVKELKNEVEILKGLDHPHIVRAIETFDYRNRLYIVLELCNGGDLYTREPYTEQQAQSIVKSLFSAVSYLHSRDIVHRDLKFENIMFVNHQTWDIKLIDFGLSQKFAANELLHDQVGTVYTMAPELLAGDYTSQADVWSLGVIAFMLLSSSMPFYGKIRVQVIKRIIRAKYRFSARRWATITQQAMEFCSLCLTRDPDERPTAGQAQHLQWLTRELPPQTPPSTPAAAGAVKHPMDPAVTSSQGTSVSNFSSSDNLSTELPPSMAQELDQMDKIQSSILAFSEYSRLKKLALLIVAYKSTTEEIGFLRKMFEKFDTEKDGEITRDEFQRVLSAHYDYTMDELGVMFAGIDVDGTGSVHYSEFLAATLEADGMLDEERLAEAFDRLDSDDSGYITLADLRDFLGETVPDKYLHDVIDEVDIEGDHRISYREFMAQWSTEDDDRLSEVRSEVASRHLTPTPSFVSSISDSYHGSTTDDEEVPNDVTNGNGLHVYDDEALLQLQQLDKELDPNNVNNTNGSATRDSAEKKLLATMPPPPPAKTAPSKKRSQSVRTLGSNVLGPDMKDAMESANCFRALHAQSVRPMVQP